MSAPVLLMATRNPGKMREYRELLSGWAGSLISLDDAGVADEVEETGHTFLANAHLKASEYARRSGCLTISDDSGLEVHALGGAPGVYSARYGGDACASDGDRVELLLSNLEDVPWERRIARFRCFTAIAGPGGQILSTVVGSIAGMVQYQPKGEHGVRLRSGVLPAVLLQDHRGTAAGRKEPHQPPRRRGLESGSCPAKPHRLTVDSGFRRNDGKKVGMTG